MRKTHQRGRQEPPALQLHEQETGFKTWQRGRVVDSGARDLLPIPRETNLVTSRKKDRWHARRNSLSTGSERSKGWPPRLLYAFLNFSRLEPLTIFVLAALSRTRCQASGTDSVCCFGQDSHYCLLGGCGKRKESHMDEPR
jgi:hypothetical protein